MPHLIAKASENNYTASNLVHKNKFRISKAEKELFTHETTLRYYFAYQGR